MPRGHEERKQIATDVHCTVTGRHLSVTQAMKDYALEKLSKLEKFTNKIIDIQVTMDVIKLEHTIDIVIKFDHFKIRAHAATEDMYHSIDKAVSKLQGMVRKYKSKMQTHQAKGLSAIDMKVNVLKREFVDDFNDSIEEETQRLVEAAFKPHEIVKTETRPLKILSREDAIMKMDLSNDVFLVYKSEQTRKIEIIYRRKDGNYGVIEAE